MAASIGEILGSTRCQTTPTATVAVATSATHGRASPKCVNVCATRPAKALGGDSIPRKFPSWESRMNTPSAAVKPTMTEFDTKFTSVPNLSRPSASMMTPDISASVNASST